MRTVKSVLVVTRMGYVEGPTYMEPISFEKKINPNCTPGSHHSTAVFGGRKIRLCAQLKICPRVWLVAR